MQRGEIVVDPRHLERRIKTAMQGSAIRALVELVTNCDDSYVRLRKRDSADPGKIRIGYDKPIYDAMFYVQDFAEGMSHEKVADTFKTYGGDTSGSSKGELVRGYFGQGAKDALAGMQGGRICTFKDGEFTECRLFIENGKVMYELEDSRSATAALHHEHNVNANGTVAYFRQVHSDRTHVPSFETVFRQLCRNYMLRKILMNPQRSVELVNTKDGVPQPVRYLPPEGEEILREELDLSVEGFGPLRLSVTVQRADIELRQSGDDRDGGLLILDEADAVLGISLFKYDAEPLASHLFGEVKISGFRRLLDEGEAVLKEEREGLNGNHPVCSEIIKALEGFLQRAVKLEEERRQKEQLSKIDAEERQRYRKACSMLNNIAETEIQEAIELGSDLGPVFLPPPNGLALFPPTAMITVGKRYGFRLVINSGLIDHGSKISVHSASPHLRIVTPFVDVPNDDPPDGVWVKHVTVEGTQPGTHGKLECSSARRVATADIQIKADVSLLLEEGLAFWPESLTLTPDELRHSRLYLDPARLGIGAKVQIRSDKATVRVSPETVDVEPAPDSGGFPYQEITVCGERTNEDAIVTAECEDSIALLDIHVRSKLPPAPSGQSGMFKEPSFSQDTGPQQPVSYSAELGQIIIYVRFPSVQMYLGPAGDRRTLSAQVRIADLFADMCFQVIARRKVEMSGALRPETVSDLVQRNVYELARKHGKRLHEVLVNQTLLKDEWQTAAKEEQAAEAAELLGVGNHHRVHEGGEQGQRS